MSYSITGKCSICGGNVVLPHVWFGIYPPNETCSICGAIKDDLPVIKMTPVNTKTISEDVLRSIRVGKDTK